ncbi:hypothetical protein SCUCBS95973_000710 [Sporothrix curviconia]|uniref:Uncharacterized protein n=1 Tax=Sporothrix curviconia TaxID=1260050 RepID=A0ABP0ASI3_9PEZI
MWEAWTDMALVYMSDRMYWLLKRWDPQWAAQLAMVHKYGPTRPDWTEHGEEAPRDGRILDTVQRCRMRTLNVAYALNSLFPALYPYNSDLARGVLAQAFQTLRDNDDGTLQGLHLVVQMRERQYVPMHLDVLCDCMRGLKGLKHVAIEYDDGAESDEPAQMEIVRDLATAVPTLQFVSIALEPWRIWRTGPYGAAILEPAGVQGTEQGIVRLERLSRVEAMDYELYRLVESLDRWGPNVY